MQDGDAGEKTEKTVYHCADDPLRVHVSESRGAVLVPGSLISDERVH